MTLTNSNFNVQEHIDMAMKVGQSAVRVMEVLDKAHTNRLVFLNQLEFRKTK